MRSYSRLLFLILLLAVSCCKTLPSEIKFGDKIPLIVQHVAGYCRISISRDELGPEGDLVEISVDSVYYGIFLMNFKDSLVIPCVTGKTAIFKIDTNGGLLVNEKKVLIPPFQVK